MQKQKLQQKHGLNLSPQQMQFLSLLQIPLASLHSRIQDELEENPALEESENSEDINIDELEEENNNSYKYRLSTNSDYSDNQISNTDESLSSHLKKQLLTLNLPDDEVFLIEYLIDSLDHNGWISRELFSISDDLLINLNLEFSEEEIERSLLVVQSLEPYGVGARNLKECLLIQLKNKDNDETIERTISVLENQYERFSKKNFEGIIKELGISESQLKEVYETVEKLNPFPASNFSKTIPSSYITPDFLVNIIEEKNVVSLTKISGKELRVNSSYQKMMEETKDEEAQEFIKKNLDQSLI